MALSLYLVRNSDGIEHTVQLSPEDADRYGDAARPVEDATQANKAAKPASK